MLHIARVLRAEVTVNSSTASVGGRLIRIRKKAKWLDRRSTRIPHNGKDVWNFGEQPSCALCHVRFRFKQDYDTHKQSELHLNRQRWVDTMHWWRETGQPAYLKDAENQWVWFEEKVLPQKAKEMQCSLEEARCVYRRATMIESPHWHKSLQCPTVKRDVKEPRDQRWPASPKW